MPLQFILILTDDFHVEELFTNLNEEQFNHVLSLYPPEENNVVHGDMRGYDIDDLADSILEAREMDDDEDEYDDEEYEIAVLADNMLEEEEDDEEGEYEIEVLDNFEEEIDRSRGEGPAPAA